MKTLKESPDNLHMKRGLQRLKRRGKKNNASTRRFEKDCLAAQPQAQGHRLLVMSHLRVRGSITKVERVREEGEITNLVLGEIEKVEKEGKEKIPTHLQNPQAVYTIQIMLPKQVQTMFSGGRKNRVKSHMLLHRNIRFSRSCRLNILSPRCPSGAPGGQTRVGEADSAASPHEVEEVDDLQLVISIT